MCNGYRILTEGDPMSANNGGPAFPRPASEFAQNAIFEQDGMTLRDYFAAKAMQGDWAAQNAATGEFTNGMTVEQLTERAGTYYRMADAMLAARDK
jgi:hypothetical protein